MTIQPLIFTDLDGSLLDHNTYDHSPANSALERLKACGVPLIPVSSKTLIEMETLPIDFGNAPFIAENGMAVKCPKGLFNHFNGIHSNNINMPLLLETVNAIPPSLRAHFKGVPDMSVEDIARETNLDLERSAYAKKREASIFFLWSGTEEQLNELRTFIAKRDLRITRGGRFYHLMGQGSKGESMLWVIKQFEKQNPDTRFISIALGDGANDVEMLSTADHGIKIPNPHGRDFDIPAPKGRIITASEPGPVGWNLAVHAILDELGLSR